MRDRDRVRARVRAMVRARVRVKPVGRAEEHLGAGAWRVERAEDLRGLAGKV